MAAHSAHLANMNVITHPWESENGFVGMGSTISRTRLGGDGGRLSSFHYTQASAIMKAILIGFNACGGARSCYLMALTKEYESVIIKPHSPAVLHAHWSSFTILAFWRWRERLSAVRGSDTEMSVQFVFWLFTFYHKIIKIVIPSCGLVLSAHARFESNLLCVFVQFPWSFFSIIHSVKIGSNSQVFSLLNCVF